MTRVGDTVTWSNCYTTYSRLANTSLL